MSISFDKALGMREHALSIRADRASILSSNLANVDTPNFKARDIDFQAELKNRMGGHDGKMIRSTHSKHMALEASIDSEFGRLYRLPTQPSIDGNTVEGHVEHAEFMKNSMEFQVAFTMLSSSFKGLRKAIKGD